MQLTRTVYARTLLVLCFLFWDFRMQTQTHVMIICLWLLPLVPKWTTFLLYCTFYILQGNQCDWVTTERIPLCDSAALLLSSAVNIKERKSRPYDNLCLVALRQKGTAKCVHLCSSSIQCRVRKPVLLDVECLLLTEEVLTFPTRLAKFYITYVGLLFNNTCRTEPHWDYSPLA